ncbi:hypothetical protein [Chryseobacterium lathyri]|uniref:C1q domain-containing protein n=1 Tax=Chryseobacterium lathyri TaxID=395933 RepID=A0ABT9SJY1_9FLAO|nr:hypothetical protein [Chryseobacterium lathyri]MDP9959734.1 hypothetical protein [Chryseobacterium lathyri]MDQ0064693.1 hypothetical protein [Chryseobacterium lathyri]
MKIKNLYKLLFFFLSFFIQAQTGIFTKDPMQTFHIDGAKDNSSVPPSAPQILNDIVVTSDGKLGVGLLNPKTKVDVRSADQKGIIGLGTSTQTAAAAGGGAIRYSNGNIIQYSDGVSWHSLPMALPPKAVVLANNNSSLALTNNATTLVNGWSVVTDSQSNFNGTTFTAPRNGFYIVSFSITLADGNIAQNSRIETIIESNTATNNIQTYRSVNSYPAWDVNTVNNIVGGNCTAIFNLSAGNTIQFKVFHNFGGNRSINTANTGTNNSISIYEL